ncbi:hypothetical protein ACFSTC_38920 [Nonomuraea ferruginea]
MRGGPRTTTSARTWPSWRDASWLSGLDVIAVDITSPEAKACGMSAAKVIVPGTAPMTFGHRYRRVHGLPRLLSLPRLLGHRDRDLGPEELNPYPHPFP